MRSEAKQNNPNKFYIQTELQRRRPKLRCKIWIRNLDCRLAWKSSKRQTGFNRSKWPANQGRVKSVKREMLGEEQERREANSDNAPQSRTPRRHSRPISPSAAANSQLASKPTPAAALDLALETVDSLQRDLIYHLGQIRTSDLAYQKRLLSLNKLAEVELFSNVHETKSESSAPDSVSSPAPDLIFAKKCFANHASKILSNSSSPPNFEQNIAEFLPIFEEISPIIKHEFKDALRLADLKIVESRRAHNEFLVHLQQLDADIMRYEEIVKFENHHPLPRMKSKRYNSMNHNSISEVHTMASVESNGNPHVLVDDNYSIPATTMKQQTFTSQFSETGAKLTPSLESMQSQLTEESFFTTHSFEATNIGRSRRSNFNTPETKKF
ncbi:hypothetical protein HK096_003555 [Nowakowskiella sp. JEL0078]|nr:hypothetical protein HK096_003555 [Nowakowskiella sp. JEL0078]